MLPHVTVQTSITSSMTHNRNQEPALKRAFGDRCEKEPSLKAFHARHRAP